MTNPLYDNLQVYLFMAVFLLVIGIYGLVRRRTRIGDPLIIPLSGGGTAPVTVLPGLLTFTAPVATTSTYQTVTIPDAYLAALACDWATQALAALWSGLPGHDLQPDWRPILWRPARRWP